MQHKFQTTRDSTIDADILELSTLLFNRGLLHEHARPLKKRFEWTLTTGSAFVKMARLKVILAITLLVGLG